MSMRKEKSRDKRIFTILCMHNKDKCFCQNMTSGWPSIYDTELVNDQRELTNPNAFMSWPNPYKHQHNI